MAACDGSIIIYVGRLHSVQYAGMTRFKLATSSPGMNEILYSAKIYS